MASMRPSTIAAGARPATINSSRTELDELEPRVASSIRTRPAIDAPRCSLSGSVILPSRGSTPPQKLSGAAQRSTRPRALPAITGSALTSTARRP
jgi:hypothetical protein